jgi:hypothetical protein
MILTSTKKQAAINMASIPNPFRDPLYTHFPPTQSRKHCAHSLDALAEQLASARVA